MNTVPHEDAMKTLVRPTFKPLVPGPYYWLGQNVFHTRHQLKMTQETLASAAGITSRCLRDIENSGADYDVKLSTVIALANALKVEVPALFKKRRETMSINV